MGAGAGVGAGAGADGVVVAGAEAVLAADAVLASGPLWSLDFLVDAPMLLADAVLDSGPLLSREPRLSFLFPSRNGCLRPSLGETPSRAFCMCALASPWSSMMYGRLVGDLAPLEDFFFTSADLLLQRHHGGGGTAAARRRRWGGDERCQPRPLQHAARRGGVS